MVIVGPEKPLVNGITDFLEKKKINVFGPKKKSAQLEGSKIFTKLICKKYNIPTANFNISKNVFSPNLLTLMYPVFLLYKSTSMLPAILTSELNTLTSG